MKLIFFIQLNLLQIDTMIQMEMIKHPQSSQNSKFAFTISQKSSQEWSSFFAYRETSQFLKVGIIVFDGSDQTYPTYPKQEVGNNFAIYQYIAKKGIATAFVFYCDAKHSDILRGSIHVRCYLFLGGCGQKWVRPFRSWI